MSKLSVEQWRRAQAVFADLMDAGEDRESQLSLRLTGEPELQAAVRKMWRADEDWEEAEDPDRPHVPGYEIVREIGRGGMSVVYEGRRAEVDFDLRVAIKVLPHGLEGPTFSRRFRAERAILARLHHPNIARLIDGGLDARGVPYLVMELVEGEDLLRFSRGRGRAERLRLAAKVAGAVHHAHSGLLVHRDLKPSNVLVTSDGTPKLLDFGIAKVVEPGEEVAQTSDLMTPRYASPEQLRGDSVGPATDIYSLGLLLQEVFADDARDPSLQFILRNALGEAPEDRYSSARALAEDIYRVLRGEPPLGARLGVVEHGRLFIRRHRGAAAVVLALSSLCVGLGWRYWQERSAREKAAVEQAAVKDFMLRLFRSPTAQDARAPVAGLADVAERALTQAAHHPGPAREQAELHLLAGRVLAGELRADRASAALTEADRILREQVGGDDPMRVDTLLALGGAQRMQGRLTDSVASLRTARGLLERNRGSDAVLLSRVLNSLAGTLDMQGRIAEARELYDQTYNLRRTSLEAPHPLLAQSLYNNGVLAWERGALGAAEEAVGASLAMREKLGAPSYTVMARTMLARILAYQGRQMEAEQHFEQALHDAEQLAALHPLRALIRTVAVHVRLELWGQSPDPLALRVAEEVLLNSDRSSLWMEAVSYLLLAEISLAQGDVARADLFLTSASARVESTEFGGPRYRARLRALQARVAAARGNDAQARLLGEEAERLLDASAGLAVFDRYSVSRQLTFLWGAVGPEVRCERTRARVSDIVRSDYSEAARALLSVRDGVCGS